MAKVAYIPYDDTMAQIFEFFEISISTSDFGGKLGWAESDYVNARALARDLLFDYETIDIDGDGADDWFDVDDLLFADYTVAYWSTDSGHDPY